MEIGATRNRCSLNIEPMTRCGRLTGRPVMKRPSPPAITHWDDVSNGTQSATSFFPSLPSSSSSPLGQCSQSAEGQDLHKHPPHTLIFPSPRLYLRLTCTPLNAKEHFSQHKWVKQVILKLSWVEKRSVEIAHTSTWFLRFLLRVDLAYLLPFMFMPNTSPLLIIP